MSLAVVSFTLVEAIVDTPTVLSVTIGEICDNLLTYIWTSLIARWKTKQTSMILLLINIYGICVDFWALEGLSYRNKHSVSTIFPTSVVFALKAIVLAALF